MINTRMALLLGLDTGTTSLKTVLYDTDSGQVIRVATRPTPVIHPRNDWSEHDPQALWEAVAGCIHEAASGQPVAGLAISSMAEAGVLMDASGQALSPIIAWYDRRSEPQAAWIEQKIPVDVLYNITGQRASPSFGLTKLLWIRDTLPQVFKRGALWLPVPSYILWRLTGKAVVDYTIAARTLLFDQRTLNWSSDLLDAFDLPPSLFPPAAPSGALVGSLTSQAAGETGLPQSTICALGGHDHLCAALAAGAYASGAMVDSTGSANALLLLMPRFLPNPALAKSGYASYTYVLKDRYALKGGLKAAGSAVEWLARQLSAPGSEPDYAGLETAAEKGVARQAGPLWLPHLIGSGTPQGDRFSRAALIGVQFEHNRGDQFRGLLESLALWTRHNLEAMQDLTQQSISSFTLLGGITRLHLLSQLKADALNRPVLIPQVPEAAATGAALLAGLGAGVFSNPAEALSSLHYPCTQIDPIPQHVSWYDTLYRQVYLPLYTTLKPINDTLNSLRPPNL
jgi:xylulokinase